MSQQQNIDNNNNNNNPLEGCYDLVSLEAPRLYGLLLKSTVYLAESGLLNNAFLNTLYKKNKFNLIGTSNIDCMPLLYPLVPPQESNSEFRYTTYTSDEFIKDLNIIDIYQGKRKDINSSMDYYNAYKSGKTNPLIIAKKFIDLQKESDQHEPPLKAFIKINSDSIIEQAQASKERWDSNNPLSVLDGVLISIKDEIDIKGYHTTCGTTFLPKIFSEKTTNAFVVEKLLSLGAIITGKVNMHELGISTLGYNVHYGFTRNPFNLNHYPGGSSSGSASSVSSGLNPISIGCDGGGSIRVPASLCGVVGLKPTFGRVSHHGVFDLCSSVGHVGPLGSSVVDTAIGYAAIAGRDSSDFQTEAQPTPTIPNFSAIPLERPLSKLRVGVFRPWFNDCNQNVLESCNKSLQILEEAGANIIDIELPNLLFTRLSQAIIIVSEMRNSMNKYLDQYRHELHLDTRLTLSLINVVPSTDYIQANRIRSLIIKQLQELFKSVDVIVSPTSAVTAPEIEKHVLGTGESNINAVGDLMRYAFLANISGVPGISIPIGVDHQNLPIGFQIMGKWWEEDLLLYVGYVLEKNIKFTNEPKYFKCPLAHI
ncbi:hypothetical protein CYY_005814 [Polysphondylium violaceum]|uniref:Amidase domain-containing protein n=1 Tax=Polysphondylium violaceum TaxID=133409 RepID=A0A8J4Q258_9MYCE|nr:hypothetical protein CYY_005814 [Polysphondylium violaceum]